MATNIAESSLTIPGVEVVIDSGLHRSQMFDQSKGISTLALGWTPQSSVKQRLGRAGRLCPGTNIRLFTKEFYEKKMRPFDPAEIECAPLEKIYTQVKSLSDTLPPQFITEDIANTLQNVLGYGDVYGIARKLTASELL